MPEAARAAKAYSPPPEDAGSGRPTSLRQRKRGVGEICSVMEDAPASCMHPVHAAGTGDL